jgi:hypothetical protein
LKRKLKFNDRSLKKGLFQNEVRYSITFRNIATHFLQVWVGIFGLIAAAASFRSGWKATALTPPPSSRKADNSDPSKDGDDVVGYDVSLTSI